MDELLEYGGRIRHRERIGGVVGLGNLFQFENYLDHLLHLFFVGGAVANIATWAAS